MKTLILLIILFVSCTPPQERKTIILTFDYELDAKIHGSACNCVVDPTNQILDLLDRYHAKATFFVDLIYFGKYPDSLVYKQIRRIYNDGHEIAVHFHTSWVDGGGSNADIGDCFKTWFDIKNKIIPECNPVSYRAGSLFVQSFGLKSYFNRYGLKIDCSVAKGIRVNSVHQPINFILAPDKSYYKFDDNPIYPVYSFAYDSAIENTGSFIEIPITTYQTILFRNVGNQSEKFCDGVGFGFDDMYAYKTSLERKMIKYRNFISVYRMYTLEGDVNRFAAKEIDKEHRRVITFISHPKNMNKQSIKYLEYLLDNNDAISINDYYNTIINN